MESILGLAIILFYGGLALLLIGMHRENFHEKKSNLKYILGYLSPMMIFIISIALGFYLVISGKLKGMFFLGVYLLIPFLIFIYFLQSYLAYKEERPKETGR
ncbi:MAG: hypothetical protein ACLFVL_05550 [Candidatus Aenigmatarchaeota archaeon]